MIILNIGCGATRPGPPWINVDNLYQDLATPEHAVALAELRKEPNYINQDLSSVPWYFPDNSIGGILASHFFEHLDAQEMQRALREVHRILEPNGVVRISVPDPAYFYAHFEVDDREHAVEVFGEPLLGQECDSFRDWALFFHGHKQILCALCVSLHLLNAGFALVNIHRTAAGLTTRPGHPCAKVLAEQDNRSRFSLFMEAYK